MSSLDSVNNNLSIVVSTEQLLLNNTSTSLSIPIPQPAFICDLPGEIVMHIVQLGNDVNSVGILAFTCHTLFNQLFVHAPLSSKVLSTIVSRLIQLQDLPAIIRFCNQINYQDKPALDLHISNKWEFLRAVFERLHTNFQIRSLTVTERAELEEVFDACTACKFLKKLVSNIQNFVFKDVPLLPSVEELQIQAQWINSDGKCEKVTLSQILERFPALKRLETRPRIVFDIDKLTPSSNGLEYYPSNSQFTNEDYSSLHDTAETVTTGLTAYYFGCACIGEDNGEKAKEFLRKSIALSPRLVQAKEELANLIADTQPEEAVKLLKECIEIFPQYVPDVPVNVGNSKEAIHYLEQIALSAIKTGKIAHALDIIQNLHCSAPLNAKQFIKQHAASYPYLFLNIAKVLEQISYDLAIVSRVSYQNSTTIPSFKPSPDLDLVWQLVFNKEDLSNDELFDFVRQKLSPDMVKDLRKALQKRPALDMVLWFSIFDMLKTNGKDIRPLLDEFCASHTTLNKHALYLLLIFLSPPKWEVERQRLLCCLQFQIQEENAAIMHCVTSLKDESIVKELCELIRLHGDVSLQHKVAPYLVSPALIPMKIEFLYNNFRSDPEDIKTLIALAEAYVESKNMKQAERFFTRALIARFSWSDEKEQAQELLSKLQKLQLFEELQQRIQKKIESPEDSDDTGMDTSCDNLLALGEDYVKQNDMEKAKDWFTKAADGLFDEDSWVSNVDVDIARAKQLLSKLEKLQVFEDLQLQLREKMELAQQEPDDAGQL